MQVTNFKKGIMDMNATDIKKWLDDNFEEHEEYLVEVRLPDMPQGQHKYFVVSVEVPQQIGGALYEFTRGGGEITDHSLIDLDDENGDKPIGYAESLVVSEHLFQDEGAIDIPIVLDLPDPRLTSVEKIEARFENYARSEGEQSLVEQYGSDTKPDEISKKVLASALETYRHAVKEHAEEPSMTMAALVNGSVSADVNDVLESIDRHDAYGDVYFSDENPLRDFANWADELFADLGVKTNLVDGCRESFEAGCMDKDTTMPLDWFDDDVVINFHPTIDPDDDLDDGVVTCDSLSGDAFNVVPDEAFRRTLEFLNISGQEFADHIMLLSGGNYYLTSDRQDWEDIVSEHGSLDAWCPKADPEKDSLVSLPNLVELIENTNGYGAFTWSINVNMKDLLSTPPGEKVSLSGGQIGFHDYANGSGHMEGYAIGSKEVELDKIAFVPDRLKSYGLEAVYGMTWSATEGGFEWPKESKQRYLDSRMSVYLENMKDRGLPESKEGISVNEEGHGYFSVADGGSRELATIYKTCEHLYGKYPDFDHLLTEKDRDFLDIKAKSPSIDLNL